LQSKYRNELSKPGVFKIESTFEKPFKKMMTEDNQQNFGADEDADATLVAPRFDEAAAETARPVVPLAESINPYDGQMLGPAPAYRQPPVRRSWVIALVLVSALVGSVLGGLGLRLYQKRQRASAQTIAPAQTAAAPVETETAQPQQEVSATTRDASAASETATAQISETQPPNIIEETETTPERAAEDIVRIGETRKPDDSKKRDEALSDDRRKSNDVDDDDKDGKRKKGKRGGVDDDDAERNERAEQPRARRVGVITYSQPRRVERIRDSEGDYRPRRERPRHEQQSRDRVRAIFEGQPPR
jgi:hypothetical protein